MVFQLSEAIGIFGPERAGAIFSLRIFRYGKKRINAMLSSESRRIAGILLVVFPTVLYGGVSLLMFLSTEIRVTWRTRYGKISFVPDTRTPGCCWCCL
jgi:hypothetical protein